MPIKAAMVACCGPATGPWSYARGSELEVSVRNLEDTGRVEMECLDGAGSTSMHKLSHSGTFPFPSDTKKYRFIKHTRGLPTTIEVSFK